MSQFTILRDTREQKGWEFENFDVDVRDETLNTGDYSVAELCDHDEKLDTYYPNYAIERKGGKDFIASITTRREAFRDEIARASDWDSPLLVLIEEPKRTFRRMQKFMRHRDVTRSQVFGTVEKWERYYNVEFKFKGDRQRCQRLTHDTLLENLRAKLI